MTLVIDLSNVKPENMDDALRGAVRHITDDALSVITPEKRAILERETP